MGDLCTQGMALPALAKLPPFPAVALKLLSLLSDEQSSFASIASCIATDPVLSGQLIQRANAADMATYCEASTVLQAVAALGMDRTRELSLTIATANYANAATRTESLKAWWRHTVACALAASELARQCGLPPAAAYTAGLLHDIGRLGLMSAHGRKYEEAIAAAEGRSSVLDLERAAFGVDHLEAGAWLAREWKLPESLVEVIAQHHDPPRRGLSEPVLTQIACRLADLLGFPADRFGEPASFEETAAPLHEGMRLRLRARLPNVKAAILNELRLSDPEENSGGGERVEEPEGAEPAATMPGGATTSWAAIGAMIAAAVLIGTGVVVLMAR